MKILGIGEIMIQLNPLNKGPIRHVNIFERHVAGSEANVIIGLTRLGFETEFFTVVGDDEFGKCIISTLNSEKVGTRFIKTKNEFTAVYFVQRGFPVPDKTMVYYYRKGSAFSKLSPEDISNEMYKNIDVLFVSGITPSLSDSCKEVTVKAFNLAKQLNIKIVFDTNIRKKLLNTPENAINTLKFFINNCDILITGSGDLDFLFPDDNFDEQLNKLKKICNTDFIVIKMSKIGAKVYKGSENFFAHGYQVQVVDELGAGDAFDAAFLASIFSGRDIGTSLKYANAAGAIVVSSLGDIEPLPNWNEIETFLNFYESKESGILR